MDILGTFAPDVTSFLHLKSPITEEPMYEGDGDDKEPVGITFHTPGTDAYEAANNRRTNRALARSKKNTPLTADLLRTDGVDFLADITVSLHHVDVTYGTASGSALYRALYADRRLGWIVDQANSHLADWANFLPKSEKN